MIRTVVLIRRKDDPIPTDELTITDRDHVIAVADMLYYTRGIQIVGMDELRTTAGISLKKLYTMFPSKEAIVLAVLERRHTMWNAGITGMAADAATPRERILSIFDFLLFCFSLDYFRGCGFINTFGELGASFPAVTEAVRAQKESFQQYVATLVADAGGPGYLAPQLALLAEGAQTTAAIAGTADAAHDARAAAITLIDAAIPAA